MFHLCAWSGTTPAAAQTAFDLPPVVEPTLHIQNNHFIVPKPMNLKAAWIGAANLTKGRFNSGSIRQTNPLYIRPTELAVKPTNNPPLSDWRNNPYRLIGPEELILEVGDSNVAGELVNAWALLSDDNQAPAPSGPKYNLRFTSTTAAVINQWTQLAILLETSLPMGNYAVIGCEVQSTNIWAFRMIFDNAYWRPGLNGITALQNRQRDLGYDGSLGLWGVFNTISLPRIEVLCTVADAVFEGYIQVVRTNIVAPGYAA